MMIKRLVFALFIISMISVSCLKKTTTSCTFTDSNVNAPDSQAHATLDSLHAYQIFNATLDPAGFYYIINNAGSGAAVSGLCSTVYVTYKGTYFNGVAFDSSATNSVASFQLGQAIVGWQKALPLLSKGGVMTLYLPPALAYGPNPVRDNFGNIVIPGNSYLVFNINLKDIQ